MRRLRDGAREARDVVEGLTESAPSTDQKAVLAVQRAVAAAVDTLRNCGRLPPARAAELQTTGEICNHIAAAQLAPGTLTAMARSGLNMAADAETNYSSTMDGDASAYVVDLGGSTPEGEQRAAALMQAAEEGDHEAEFELASLFMTADGVARNEAEALRRFTSAAELGHSLAQNCLGTILRNGLCGVAVDKALAFQWMQRSAEGGDAEAQFNLAEMCHDGEGRAQDSLEALAWAERAARSGLAEAQYKAGVMLLEGDGVERDKEKAMQWLRQAAGQGLPEALSALGALSSDAGQAAAYYAEAAARGDAHAQFSLGMMLTLGVGVEADEAAARQWLLKAAAQGHTEAEAHCVGVMLPEVAESVAAEAAASAA